MHIPNPIPGWKCLARGWEGVGGTFIWGGSAPKFNPLPFHIPFLAEKALLSHTQFTTFHLF